MKSFIAVAASVALSTSWSLPLASARLAESPSIRGRTLDGSAAPTQLPPYPLNVAEAQGAIIGDTFYIFSGYHDSFSATTNRNHALNLANPSDGWQALQDDFPGVGVTAAATVVVKDKFYMCGGYHGGSPGPQTNECLVYDPQSPASSKWSYMAPLPGVGRSGGGLVYDSAQNALIFAGGAVRVKVCEFCYRADDFSNTWMYYLDFPERGWTAKADIPFQSNHMASVTVKDVATGQERHFFAGGQQGEVGLRGVNDQHYEYVVDSNTWVARASLPMPRSHMMSSTRALDNNGYSMVGGRTTGGVELKDVIMYNMETDTWTGMGDMAQAVHSSVCDLYRDNMYCQTGMLDEATAASAAQQLTV